MSGCECKRDSAQPVLNVLSVRFPFFSHLRRSGLIGPPKTEVAGNLKVQQIIQKSR